MSNDAKPHCYTLGTAAKATGKSKSTLLEAIKKGKFSVMEKSKSGYKIDPAELHRVYPSNAQYPSSEQNTPMQEIARLLMELKLSETELAGIRTRLQDRDKQLEDVLKDRDHWRQQATYLLEGKQEITEQISHSWFRRIFKS